MEELSVALPEFTASYENINYYVYCPWNCLGIALSPKGRLLKMISQNESFL